MFYWQKSVPWPLHFWLCDMSTNAHDDAQFSHCIEALKQSDQYAQLLFLPAELRGPAAAILAFQQEIDRIPYLVSEPMPGEVRLQWWREVFLSKRDGEANANPLASSLLATVEKYDLPKEGFVRFLDAKVFDLYNDPMPDRATLEAYLGESESFILQMLALMSGVEHDTILANACGHSGVALGIANILLRTPFHMDKQQTYIPVDLIEACGIDAASWLSTEAPNHVSVYQGFVGLGQEHLKKAKLEIVKLPKDKRGVFLSLSCAELVFKHASKKTKNLRDPIVISPLSKQWALMKTFVFGL